MNNYVFTENWFSGKDLLLRVIPFNKTSELHFLEIGSFEGLSSIWFLETFLHNPASTLTCIDSWLDYSNTPSGMEAYNKEDAEWKFKTKNIKETFLSNIAKTKAPDRVIVKHGFAHEMISSLILSHNQYDFVYIDGNHAAPFVLTDAVFSWYVLKVGGFMVFDDYGWEVEPLSKTFSPKFAIDSFISNFKDCSEVVFTKGNYIGIRRIK